MPCRCSVLCEVNGVKDMVPTPKVRVLASHATYAVTIYATIRDPYGSQEAKSRGTGSVYSSKSRFGQHF